MYPAHESSQEHRMNTDPNPFRESPDSDRSSSSTEAPDDSTRDFAEVDEEMQGSGASGSSPMSEGEEDSSASTGGEENLSADETGGVTSPDSADYEDRRISGEPKPV
jgi:hypothetical protein